MITMPNCVPCLVAVILTTGLTGWAEGAVPRPTPRPGPTPPVKELERPTPQPSAFDGATWKKPVVLRSAKDGAKYFSEEELAKLSRQVDFAQQFVLVFVWRGSGQDRLESVVAESFPEQVSFKYRPGRTRDLRPHVHAYALRANVKWSAATGTE